MTIVTRYSTSAVLAGFVTFSLFFLMQILIAERDELQLDTSPVKELIIFKVPDPADPLPPDTPEEAILEPDMPVYPSMPAKPMGSGISFPRFDPIVPAGPNELMTGNTDPVLRFAILPAYPVHPQSRGIEGYALVEFTIAEDGTVIDAVLLDEEPKGYGFGRAAMTAIVKFRYEPRIVGGQAVAVHGIKEQFLFELPEE